MRGMLLAGGLALALLAPAGASADPWKDESGHGWRGGRGEHWEHRRDHDRRDWHRHGERDHRRWDRERWREGRHWRPEPWRGHHHGRPVPYGYLTVPGGWYGALGW